MIAPALPQRVSSQPPPQLVRAAKAAAASPHGLVNLIRLVGSLDTSSVDRLGEDEEDDPAAKLQRRRQLKKDLESASYARVLLDALQNGNEQSSTTASTLRDLDGKLRDLEDRYTAVLSSALPGSAPLSKTASRQSATSDRHRPQPADTHAAPAPNHAEISPKPATPETTVRRRNVPPLSKYLATRAAEDEKGGEAGLLPLRARPAVPEQKSDRDHLLAGGIGMGAAQLHEELGGQLADMSHRLKLNAVHFSNSLEAEKALLESSQQTLEGNLSATRTSKKHLSSVSSKGRSTTCMTLGIVILVLVIFVWTYMLIRFT